MFDALVNRLLLAHADAAIVHTKMFGLPAIKVNGKLCAVLEGTSLVCRLSPKTHTIALSLPGAHLFQPYKERPPMKEWIVIPFANEKEWARFASRACEYILTLVKASRA